VTTNPAGADVTIDGRARGVTPITAELPPGQHVLAISVYGEMRTIPITIVSGREIAQFIELPPNTPVKGRLQVRTYPPGATVSVDGQARGVSPLLVENLVAGDHTVVLTSAIASVTEHVVVDPGATATLVVPLSAPEGLPLSGWIALASPVDLQIFDNGRLLGTTRSDRIMVSAGRHELDVVNDALGYRASQTVQVMPGKVASIRVDVPKGSLALNALPWAEVWVDGERIGETPIGNVQVPIGTHDVLFRHPDLGERHHAVTVTTAAPARVSADMRK
jgi:hypothetical protein